MTGYDVTRLRDLIGPVGKKLRLDDPSTAATIWRRWRHLVGDDIARNAEPTSLKEGVLRIRTSSPAWATEISYLATEITHRINEAVGKRAVREVRVWTSPAPIQPTRGDGDHTAETPRRVEQRAASEDPATAFQRAFSAWAKRRDKGRR